MSKFVDSVLKFEMNLATGKQAIVCKLTDPIEGNRKPSTREMSGLKQLKHYHTSIITEKKKFKIGITVT